MLTLHHDPGRRPTLTHHVHPLLLLQSHLWMLLHPLLMLHPLLLHVHLLLLHLRRHATHGPTLHLHWHPLHSSMLYVRSAGHWPSLNMHHTMLPHLLLLLHHLLWLLLLHHLLWRLLSHHWTLLSHLSHLHWLLRN